MKSNNESAQSHLVTLFPGLPYIGLGVCVAWTTLLSGGAGWLSDVDAAEVAITTLFPYMTIGGAVFFAACALVGPSFFKLFVERQNKLLWTSAIFCAFGALLILVVGPYFSVLIGLSDVLKAILFISGAVLAGCGASIQFVFAGCLYSSIRPPQALLYASLSFALSALLYFLVIGSPSWAPISGSPTYFSIVFLLSLPFLSSWIFSLERFLPKSLREDRAVREADLSSADRAGNLSSSKRHGALSSSTVIRALLVIVVLEALVSGVHMRAVMIRQASETLDMNALSLLIRIAVALVMVALLCGSGRQKISLGSLYTKVSATSVAVAIMVPLVGSLQWFGDAIVGAMAIVFELSFWCLLTFIAYQRRLIPSRVFGFGYAAYMVGNMLGWLFGVYGLPLLEEADVVRIVFVVIGIVLLAVFFFIFTGDDFKMLTAPVFKEDPFIEEIFQEEALMQKVEPVKTKRFAEVIAALSDCYKLSAREKDVFHLLAKGLANDRIAEELFVSVNTVRTHAQNVYVKLGVHSRQELMAFVDEELKSGGQHQ